MGFANPGRKRGDGPVIRPRHQVHGKNIQFGAETLSPAKGVQLPPQLVPGGIVPGRRSVPVVLHEPGEPFTLAQQPRIRKQGIGRPDP